MTTAVQILRALDACGDEGEAIPWVAERAPRAGLGPAAARLWAECDRGDWLIWLVSHERMMPYLADSDRRLRLVACDCAEATLPIWEAKYPDDTRPRDAIAVARRYAVGEATREELAAASDAAWAAARAAWDAAWNAAWVVSAAALDAARDAQWDAAWADAWAAARDTARDTAWADASDAARDAARAAARDASDTAWAAASDAARADQADIVRARYTWADVRRAIEQSGVTS